MLLLPIATSAEDEARQTTNVASATRYIDEVVLLTEGARLPGSRA